MLGEKKRFVTLETHTNNKVAWDFTFQAEASQWTDTTCFLTKLTTPVSWIVLKTISLEKKQHNHRLHIKDKHLV